MSDHLEAVKRQRPKEVAEAEPEPEFPEPLLYVWRWFQELHTARGSGGMSVNPVGWLDIDAFSRVTGERLLPWEARAIRAVDDAYMASTVSGETGAGSGGN